MKKFIPMAWGFVTGVVVGICLMFLPPDLNPFLWNIVDRTSGWICSSLFPNEDPMSAADISIPVWILFFALLGTIGGFTADFVLARLSQLEGMPRQNP